MATKPTRMQDQACDRLVESLSLIAEAARLDGKTALNTADWGELVSRVAKVSSAYSLDEIVNRAIDKRGKNLGLPTGTTELLTLFDAGVTPVEMLRISDDEFRSLVARMDEELGES